MKNLIPYNEDCYPIHEKAVNKKNSGEIKERLLVLNPEIKKSYVSFEEKFTNNNLGNLLPDKTFDEHKEDLLTLYKYKSSVIRELRSDIRKLQIKTIINTCQNCTVDSVNSMDHILPKSIYPQYVVNPKNLFPCCTTCNSYKLDSVEKKEKGKFLNLYLDELPDEQYLFLDIFLDDDNEINFKFYLSNVNSINEELFDIIKYHYENLHLFERMRLKSIEHVSEFENRISTFRKRLTINEIREDITEAIQEDLKVYGYNHWKCILEKSLLNSSLFIDRIST